MGDSSKGKASSLLLITLVRPVIPACHDLLVSITKWKLNLGLAPLHFGGHLDFDFGQRISNTEKRTKRLKPSQSPFSERDYKRLTVMIGVRVLN